MFLTVDR